MVFLKCLVGVLRAVLLDITLDEVQLTVGRVRVEDVNRHLLTDRESRDKLGSSALGEVFIVRILKSVERVHLGFRGALGNVVQNKLSEAGRLNLLRNELTGLFTTHRVLDSYAVLDLLYVDLTSLASLGEAEEVELGIVVGVLDYDLAHQLLFDRLRSLGGIIRDIPRVREEYLSGLHVDVRDFAGYRLDIELVVALREILRHRGELILGGREFFGEVTDCRNAGLLVNPGNQRFVGLGLSVGGAQRKR